MNDYFTDDGQERAVNAILADDPVLGKEAIVILKGGADSRVQSGGAPGPAPLQ